MSTKCKLPEDPRVFLHENSPNDGPYSEAKDLRRLLGEAVNQSVINRACLDCGSNFVIPEGTLFFNCYKRCIKCAEINDVKLEAEREAEAKRKLMVEYGEKWLATCPPLYREIDLNRLPTKSRGLMEKVVGWQRGSKGLLGIGASGAGKTRIFYQLVRRLIMEGVNVQVFDCVSFSHQCQSAFLNGRGEKWAEDVAFAPVVFFDDLFKLALTERVETELFGIIERRAAQMLPILATLNSTGEMIEQRMSGDRGKPMVRRIREFNDVVTFNL